VFWRWFRGIWLAVDGLDSHLFHQRFYVPATNLQALLPEQVAQHPAAGKRIVEMQFVDPPHQPQILSRDRARLVVDSAAADIHNFRLFSNGKIG
jgi:hypothetical protein